MKKYMLKITPVEPFTFGGENGFSFDEIEMKGTYFMNSKLVPEQTTIIGLIRYLLLESEGKLKSSFHYTEEEKIEMAKVCGAETFLFEPDEVQSFGYIREISPLFLVDRENRIYIKNPFCNKATKEQPVKIMKLQKKITCSEGEDILFPLKGEDGYDGKEGYGSGYLCIDYDVPDGKRILKNDEIFVSQMVVGNRKSEENNEDGFFKRETIIMQEMSFGVYLTLSDEAKTLKKKAIAFMGKKKALFEIEAIPVEESTSLDEQAENYFDSLGLEYRWKYCLSDALPYGKLEYNTFAIVESKCIRNLKTSYSDKKMTRKGQKRYPLISAGSVFYADVPEALKTDSNELYRVGYNHIIKMGGK